MKTRTLTLAGPTQKLIGRSALKEPQHAQMSLIGADYLYDQLRIPTRNKGKGTDLWK